MFIFGKIHLKKSSLPEESQGTQSLSMLSSEGDGVQGTSPPRLVQAGGPDRGSLWPLRWLQSVGVRRPVFSSR